MVANELDFGPIHRFRLQVDYSPGPIPASTSGRSGRYDPEARELCVGGEVWAVQPSNAEAERALETVTRGGSSLWTVYVPRPEAGEVEVHVRCFPAEVVLEDEPVLFGVDDRANDDVRRRTKQPDMHDAEVRSWLRDEFVVVEDGRPDAVLAGWGRSMGDRERYSGLTLIGRRHIAFLKQDRLGRLRIEDVAALRREDDSLPPVGLRYAPQVGFTDHTHATEVSKLAADDPGTRGTYLDLWNKYNAATLRLAIRQAQVVGAFAYHDRVRERDGWRFKLHYHAANDLQSRWERIGDLKETLLEAGSKLPPYLEAVGPTTQDLYIDALKQHSTASRVEWTGEPALLEADWATHSVFARTALEEGRRPPKPPKSGFLFLSLRGEVTQIARRREARARIAGQSNPLPQLKALIEGTFYPTPRPRRGSLVLSDAASARFGGRPTRVQQEAVRLAVGTPDLVLIQGPPGTGKTRVIAAIQAELAEQAKHSHWVSGQVLIASAQHDAVDNAAAASEVYGLPAVKIGQRFGERWTLPAHARAWAADQAGRVRERLRELPGGGVLDAIRTVRTAAAAYRLCPGTAAEIEALLGRIAEAAAPFLGPADREHLRAALERAVGHAVEPPALFIDAVNALAGSDPRADDARADSEAARQVLRWAPDGALTDRDVALLERARSPDGAPAAAALDVQASVRERLRVLSRPLPEVEETLSGVLRRLTDFAETHVDGVHEALADLARGLEGAPDALAAALQKYTVSLAATCSQSGSDSMAKAKGIGGGAGGSLSFATVIVDEAARANPLDLFIPMAMGSERVVLVGDQNQLPQLLEPEVEDEIAAVDGGDDAERRAREGSLFHLLFERLLALRHSDGVKRVITLNSQYRMHEALGDFVSRTFYPDVDIKSPRGREGFEHGLPGYGAACAAWLDVPFEKGSEDGRWNRPVEARRLAEEVARLLRAPESSALTFGVITFYSQQVRAIQDALVEVGVWSRRDDGFHLSADCAGAPPHGHPRLEVGTVDAFQGKEHDVVLLSTTRSNESRLLRPGAERFEARSRSKYGFLTLSNRLCVAMSRQKRLLIVVGDSAMALAPGAEEAVPGLAAFYALTRGADGVRVS